MTIGKSFKKITDSEKTEDEELIQPSNVVSIFGKLDYFITTFKSEADA